MSQSGNKAPRPYGRGINLSTLRVERNLAEANPPTPRLRRDTRPAHSFPALRLGRSAEAGKIKRAMIMAAGLGTRLRPLTDKVPKPLLPVKGRPIIVYTLFLLKRAGVKEVVINLHHLGDMIKGYVGNGRRYGLKVHYSHEPKILGTGGGIKNAQKYLKGGPFIVINGDVLIDIDLKKVIASHFKKGCIATMVVRRIKKGEDYTRIDIGADGLLKGFGRGDYMYTGVQILEPCIFKLLKKPSCLIEAGYKKLLGKGLDVNTYLCRGHWNDMGTLDRYYAVQKNNSLADI